MLKYFCDACGIELKHPNTFEYPCHIDPSSKNNLAHAYVDNDGNAISNRSIGIHLCNKCYNSVYTAAMYRLVMIGYNGENNN